jgi:hypothetical protein
VEPADGLPGKRRHFVPRDELLAAFEGAPAIDYEQLRADLDAIADPSPKDWYEWAASIDRHVCLGRLEDI